MYRYQFAENPVYRKFCELIHRTPENVTALEEIPFLPISFFKSHPVMSGTFAPEITFSSSGTTGELTSKHAVKSLDLYVQSFTTGFREFYGDIENYVVLALLPSYLEREGSSLVLMADELIKRSKSDHSGFYLNNYNALIEKIEYLEQQGKTILLLGVTYALLDLAEMGPFQWSNTVVMETGGMKGRRREMIREELHQQLCHQLGVASVHSEYGMTELLSQAYSLGNGRFACAPWMQVLIRDTEDPLTWQPHGKTGGINVVDLANLHSCAFIATQDLGKMHADGTFEVLGRFDHADIRGCNLMVL